MKQKHDDSLYRGETLMARQGDGWRVVDDDDYGQAVGNPKRKV
jgi:hypothetical protein